jgi:hypothetical protein
MLEIACKKAWCFSMSGADSRHHEEARRFVFGVGGKRLPPLRSPATFQQPISDLLFLKA